MFALIRGRNFAVSCGLQSQDRETGNDLPPAGLLVQCPHIHELVCRLVGSPTIRFATDLRRNSSEDESTSLVLPDFVIDPGKTTKQFAM